MNMKDLILSVQEWSKNKGLDKADGRGQFLKVVEEAAEISESLEKRNWYVGESYSEYAQEETQDAIGDTYVTLIILAQQHDVDFVELWENSKGVEVNMTVKSVIARVNSILIELGKIAGALARGKDEADKAIHYSIFRLIPTLDALAKENGLTSEDCLEMAYSVISKRKGKMVDGVFVKEEDLSK